MDWTPGEDREDDLDAKIAKLQAGDLETYVFGLVRCLIERDRRQTDELRQLRELVGSLVAELEGKGVIGSKVGEIQLGVDAPRREPVSVYGSAVLACQNCGAMTPESEMKDSPDGLLCSGCHSMHV